MMRASTRKVLLVAAASAIVAAALAGCGNSAGAPGGFPPPRPPPPSPSGPRLVQSFPGAAPSIRLGINTPSVPQPSSVFAFLIYRAEGIAFFSPSADRLIDVVEAQTLPAYDDDAAGRFGVTYSGERTFFGAGGQPDTYTVDATYNDPALQIGSTYFYRVQRLTDPDFPPGFNPPDIAALQAATLTISRGDVLSQASSPLGPVTYFEPPVTLEPAPGQQGLDPTSVRFRWTRAEGSNGRGAEEYIVEVFPGSDPGTVGNPLYRSPTQTPSGFGAQMTWQLSGSPLPGGSRLYWRVGGRRRSEAFPSVDTIPGASRYLWSSIRSLTTALTPPPVP